jgi:hypothetical protein
MENLEKLKVSHKSSGVKTLKVKTMKKNLLVVTLCFSTVFCFSQKLEENEVDEFTGNSIKRTSWELLSTFKPYFRISKINNSYTFQIKLMLGNVFSIDKGEFLMLKLDNDSIVKLPNLEYAITCTGCGAVGYLGSGAQGIHVKYILHEEAREKLKKHLVTKIRIYTSDGYVDYDTKKKNAQKIIKALEIIDRVK